MAGVPCPCHGFFGNLEFCPSVVGEGSKHPAWAKPTEKSGLFKGLMVNNSLTGQLEPFRPAHGNQVLWYTCGPTVYDSCHMGHARAYLTLDILRRIMEDYFGYEVLYHINITDVDDKIILRARQEHLLKEWTTATFASAAASPAGVVATVLEAVTAALAKKASKLAKSRAKLSLPLPPSAGAREVEDHSTALKGQDLKEDQLKALQGSLVEAAAAIAAAPEGSGVEAAKALAKACAGELGELIDAEKGSLVSDHAVFNAHSRRFEQAYLDDMDALGVRAPDVMTRVTEYVGEIVLFVERIVAKGLAYAANGSVYLSIDSFKQAGHTYRKLKPFAGDTSEADMAEGEGAIGSEAGDKKHPNDFALWKASKPGEPSWPSPWGSGRPGWHIECSVIASDILGPNLDVHAGGVDLKFPHHDNELAQSEAFYGHSQWVNYFFHAGHLDIKGLKMSKSLKNFITIRQALEKHSARQIRLMFLLQPWDKGMNYSDQTMQDAKAKEALFRNFFGAVKALLSEPAPAGHPNKTAWLSKEQGWRSGRGTLASVAAGEAGAASGTADKALFKALAACGDAVHEALCKNFDTPAVIAALCGLVKDVNTYLRDHAATAAAPLVLKCALHVTKVLKVLGVVEGSDDLGFPLSLGKGGGGADGAGGAGGGGSEEILGPYLEAFKDFRQEVRSLMRAKPTEANPLTGLAGQVLEACDKVRDEVLPTLGVRLEDLSSGGSRWKLDDPAVLLREMAEKKEAAAEAAAAKQAKDLDKARKRLGDAASAAVAPLDFFRTTRGGEFSAYDPATGLPTHGLPGPAPEGATPEEAAAAAAGGPVAKSALKKLQKALEKQTKDHEKLVAEAAAKGLGVGELVALYAAELADLEAKAAAKR